MGISLSHSTTTVSIECQHAEDRTFTDMLGDVSQFTKQYVFIFMLGQVKYKKIA
jgi:hypothetical protein